MTEDDRAYEKQWHLDKKVPIALIITIIGQGIGLFYWGFGINYRTATLERDQVMVVRRIDALEHERVPNGERIIRVETKVDNIKETVTEIKNLLRVPPDQRR